MEITPKRARRLDNIIKHFSHVDLVKLLDHRGGEASCKIKCCGPFINLIRKEWRLACHHD